MGAKSYHQIIKYFNPDFLLGKTATLERTDGELLTELADINQLVVEMILKFDEPLENSLYQYLTLSGTKTDPFSS